MSKQPEFSLPYKEMEVGQLATVYAVELEDYHDDKPYTDYNLSECETIDVIFDRAQMPCFYEKKGNQYFIGHDIYTSVLIPIAFKSIGELIPEAKEIES